MPHRSVHRRSILLAVVVVTAGLAVSVAAQVVQPLDIVAGPRIAAGSYRGDGGSSRTIEGVGFLPELVLVKGMESFGFSTGTAVVATKDFPAGTAKALTRDEAPQSGWITELLPDGFAVGDDDRVNRSDWNYQWLALRGDGVASAVGSYDGNGQDNRAIDVGFRPDYVLLIPLDNTEAVQRFRDEPYDRCLAFRDEGDKENRIQDFTATGFVVGDDPHANAAGTAYAYVALRESPGVQVGTYTGDGASEHVVTGPYNLASLVLVKRRDDQPAVHTWRNTVEWNLGYTFDDDSVLWSTVFRGLDAGSFTVGRDDRVNQAGKTYYWLVLGPSTDVAVTLAVDRTTAQPGDTLQYTVAATCRGPDRADSLVVDCPLPAGLTYVGHSAGAGNYDPGTGAWRLDGLMPGARGELHLLATVDSATVGQSLTTTASLAWSSPDDDLSSNDSAAATVQVVQADLAVDLIADRAEAAPGDTVTFTVRADNVGSAALSQVVVRDPLPAGLLYAGHAAGQGAYDPAAGDWTVGDLAAGTGTELLLRAVVDSAGVALVDRAWRVASQPDDGNPANDADSVSVAVPAADVAVAVAASDTLPYPGDAVALTVTARNLGPDGVAELSVANILPAGLTLTGAAPDQGTWNDATGRWTVGALVPGQVATLVLDALVDEGTGGQALADTVRRVDSQPVDPEPANDTDAVVLHVQQSDLLALAVAVDDTFPVTGATVNFSVTLENVAAAGATGITVRDRLPDGLVLQSAVPSQGSYDPVTGRWQVGDLGAGSSCVLLLGAQVAPGHAGAALVDTATVVALDQPENVTANNTGTASVTVQGADLQVTKSVNDPAPNTGETVTFTVALRNAGPHPATGVAVLDTLPDGLVYAAHTVDAGDYDAATGTWSVPTLAAGEQAVLQLQAVVDLDISQGAEAVNTAVVAAVDQEDPHPGDESDSAALTLQSADLSLAQAVAATAADEGEDVTLVLRLENGGPAAATGVTVRQTLDPGLVFVAADAPVDTSGGAVTWSVGDLAVGTGDSLAVIVRPAAGTAGGRLAATAAVGAVDQADPDGSNDADSDTIRVKACDLAVAVDVADPLPTVGDTVRFSVQAAGYGPDPAPDAAVAVTLDPGLALLDVTVSRGTFAAGTWNLGATAAGARDSLVARVVVQAGTVGQSLGLTATGDAGDRPDLAPENDQDAAAVSVQGSDLSLSLAGSVENPNPGQTVLLTVTVASAGPQDAAGVTVRDRLPPALLYRQHSPAGADYDPVTGIWNVGAVPAGGERALVITAEVDSGTAGTTVVDSARVVDARPADPDGDFPAAALSLRVPAVDIAVAQAASPAFPAAGDTLVLAVTAANQGPDPATGLVVTQSPPAGLELLAADRPDFDAGTGRWILGDLAAAAAETLNLRLRVGEASAGDTLLVRAAVAAVDQEDVAPGNDADTLAVAVAPRADLAVTMRVDDRRPNQGDPVSWTVTVTNGGPNPATGVVVRDSLAAGLRPDPARITWSQGAYDTLGGIWTVGELAPGAEATLSLGATVAAGTFGQVLRAGAWVAGLDQGDPVSGNDTDVDSLTVQSADVALAAFLDTDSPDEGDTVHLTVYATDNGADPADSVVVRLQLPPGLLYTGHTPPEEPVAPAPDGDGYLWDVGTVPLGAPRVLFVATAVAPGTTGSRQVARAAVAAAAQGDPDSTNNAAADTLVVGGVDLALSAPDTALAAGEGDTVVFHLDLVNHGPNAGSGIVVQDSLASGLERIGAAPASLYDPLAHRWELADLPADSAVALTLTARVAERTGGRELAARFAVAGLDQVDPDPANDTARVTVAVSVPDTGHVLVLADPAGAPAVLPGGDPVPLLAWRLVNWSVVPDTLTGLTVRATAASPGGTPAPDAAWQPLTLAMRGGGAADPWIVLGSASLTGGAAAFSPGLSLAPGDTVVLRVTGGAATAAADGDTLALSLAGPADAVFTRPVRLDGAWPLQTATPPVVDGMTTAQVNLHAVPTRVLAPGAVAEPVLDVTLPANGGRPDTLQGLLLQNLGTARPGDDIAGVSAWLDDGDGVAGGAADTLLGAFANTGDRWALSGLALPVPADGRRLLVTVDLAAGAAGGRTLRFGLPGPPEVAVRMGSDDDGLVDAPLANPYAQVINQPGLVYLSGAALPDSVVHPGDADVPLWRLVGTNTDSVAHTVTALTLAAAVASPVAHDPDGVLQRLAAWADDGDGRVTAGDTLLGETVLAGGAAAWEGLQWRLPPLATRHLLVTGTVSTTGAAEGDTVSLALARPADVLFAGTPLFQADFPLSGPRAVVDGMMAAQVAVAALPSRTVAPGDSLVPLFSLRVPGNGGAPDTVHDFHLQLRAGAAPADVARLTLWLDGGDGAPDAGGGDDARWGDLVDRGGTWEADPLALPVPAGGRWLHVTADVAPGAAEGAALQARLPRGGLVMASGNSGPLDAPVDGSAVLTVTAAPLAAELAWDRPVAAPGDTVTLHLRVVDRLDAPVDSVAADSLVVSPDGGAVVVSGPVPAAQALAPGDTALFAWRLVPAAPGTLQAAAGATGRRDGAPVASNRAAAGPLAVPATDAGAAGSVTPLLPAVVADGQEGVPAFLWLLHATGEGAASVLRLEEVSLRLEGRDGAALPAGGVVAAATVLAGGVPAGAVTVAPDETEARLRIPLAPPVDLAPDRDTAVQVVLDLRPGAATDSFRVVFPDAAWCRVRDVLTGGTVPVVFPEGAVPAVSPAARIVTPVDGLAARTAAADTVTGAQGQSGVALPGFVLGLPGGADGQSALVDTLVLAMTDGAGAVLPPAAVCRRLWLTPPGRPAVPVEPVPGAFRVAVPLVGPLTVAAGQETAVGIAVDLADTAAVGAYRLGLAAAGAAARDPLTGAPVPLVLDDPVPVGGALRVQTPATGAVVAALPEAARRATVGGRDVPLLVLAFGHPGTAGTSDIVLDSLLVCGRDEAGGAVDLSRLLDGVSLWRDGAPVATPPAVAVAGGNLLFTPGLRLPPGRQARLEVRGDIAPAAVPGLVTVCAPSTTMALADANTGARVALSLAPGQVSPLASGAVELVRVADRLVLAAADSLPAVLPAGGGAAVPALRLSVTNGSGAGSGDLWFGGLSLAVRDGDGGLLRAGEVFAGATLATADGTWQVAMTAKAADDTLLVLHAASPLVLTPGRRHDLVLSVTPAAATPAARLSLGFAAGDLAVAPADSAPGDVVVLPEPGTVLPFATASAAFVPLDLAASYANFPNPFAAGREATTFVFALPQPGRVTLTLYTPRGEVVRRLLVDAAREAGLHDTVVWDGRNGDGRVVRNGVYLAEIRVRYDDGRSERLVRKTAVVR